MTRFHVVESGSLSASLDVLCISSMNVDDIRVEMVSSASMIEVTVCTDDHIWTVVLANQTMSCEIFIQVTHSQTYNTVTMSTRKQYLGIVPPIEAIKTPSGERLRGEIKRGVSFLADQGA